MKQERADEIVRKVIYARLNAMPRMKDSEDAFHVGRMVGQMQRQLEIELSQEVDKAERNGEMKNFIILSKCDISALCNDEPVTVYIDGKPYILCGYEFFEKQKRL